MSKFAKAVIIYISSYSIGDIGGNCSCTLNIGDMILQVASQEVAGAKDAMEKIDATPIDTKVWR